MEKSMIIIGGGLTGLALGCYGRMNGYKTSIFEMHKIAGGVCTGWKRKGYTIDGAVNWVMGTKPGSSYHRFWEEVGAAQHWKIHNHDYFSHIEYEGGESFSFYAGVDDLEKYMKGIAPEDTEVIEEFAGAIRSVMKMELSADKPPELYSLLDKIKMVKMLPFGRLIKKWGTVSIEDFSRRFRNPLLRKVFTGEAFGDVSYLPMALLIMMLAWFSQKDAGYIIGGALELVGYIQRRYADLGGEIHFKSKVEKILVENGRAVGIRLVDGTEHRADWIVSAADGHTTIFDMLDGKYVDDTIRGYYQDTAAGSQLIHEDSFHS